MSEEPATKKQRYDKILKCLDGKYFEIKIWKDGFNFDAECKICENGKTIGSATNGTANLTRHIRNVHKDCIDAFYKHINHKNSSREDGLIQTNFTNPIVSDSEVKIRMANYHFTCNSQLLFFCQIQLKSLVLDYLIEANAPLNVVNLPSFNKLIQKVSGKPVKLPSRYAVVSQLEQHYIEIRHALQELLNNQKNVCTGGNWFEQICQKTFPCALYAAMSNRMSVSSLNFEMTFVCCY